MSQRPIAIIGAVDPEHSSYTPALKNVGVVRDAAHILGRELARAKHSILVFSNNPWYLEAHVVAGYVASGEARPKSIVVLYPKDRDPNIHGEFPEQKTHPTLFDPRIDPNSRWEASYYQSLPEVKGVLIVGGGSATLIMGLMALASRVPVVSLACFGGSSEEVWAMATNKPWIDPQDITEMGRARWADEMADKLVKSFDSQRANIEKLDRDRVAVVTRINNDREKRSQYATGLGIVSALLTALGVFGNQPFKGSVAWLVIYAICFITIPVSAGVAGSMFLTLRQSRSLSSLVHPPSIKETTAHGLWAGLGSAVLFFVSQVTANRDIKSLSQAVIEGTGGLEILLLFSLMIGFVAGLTYEAVFGKWEAVDASRAGVLEERPRD